MSRTLFNNCRIYRPASAEELLERARLIGILEEPEPAEGD